MRTHVEIIGVDGTLGFESIPVDLGLVHLGCFGSSSRELATGSLLTDPSGSNSRLRQHRHGRLILKMANQSCCRVLASANSLAIFRAILVEELEDG
jgi:hypothetical protein